MLHQMSAWVVVVALGLVLNGGDVCADPHWPFLRAECLTSCHTEFELLTACCVFRWWGVQLFGCKDGGVSP